jgi:DNA-binding NtrC family response regulator
MPASTATTSLAEPAMRGPFDTLDVAMKRHIERALDATRGRIEGRHGAAAILGINPHTLRARMRNLQIDWASFRPARLA